MVSDCAEMRPGTMVAVPGVMSDNKCKVCGVRKRGCSDYCRTHRLAIRRGLRRMNAEDLIVDQAGGAWWAWTRIGQVVAGGRDTRIEVLVELGAR